MVDVLLRADPSRGRSEREKQQADEIYRPGQSFRVCFHLFFLSATQRLDSFRYQRLGRLRLNPTFLKVGSTRAHVRTVSQGIDLDGDAHILFPILLLIQIVLGTLMTVRPQATDIAVIGTIQRRVIWG